MCTMGNCAEPVRVTGMPEGGSDGGPSSGMLGNVGSTMDASVPTVDAGPGDAEMGGSSGSSNDAPRNSVDNGCGCKLASSSRGGLPASLSALLLALAYRRRRRNSA
jgi:hypothetical protein